MTGPILGLRAAILAHCGADADLAALMGGTVRLYDEPPRAAEPVYAVFGDTNAEDWSTGTERGHLQTLRIVVHAAPGGARTALLAAERLDALLHEADLALDGHRLVSLRTTSVEVVRDERTRLARATVTLRAVTEVA